MCSVTYFATAAQIDNNCQNNEMWITYTSMRGIVIVPPKETVSFYGICFPLFPLKIYLI